MNCYKALAFHSADNLKALRSIKPGTEAAKNAARPLLATKEEFAEMAFKKGEIFDDTMYREITSNSLWLRELLILHQVNML